MLEPIMLRVRQQDTFALEAQRNRLSTVDGAEWFDG